jgi:ribosomal protein S18 acetylase RimI-like enzyme
MKAVLIADDFDNGRNPQQLETSFDNSFATCLAYIEDRLVGTARVLSDGVCNAYLVDVWTLTSFRRRGIASKMMEELFQDLSGQHLYLFTDAAADFYTKLGFQTQGLGLGLVIGRWLDGNSE